MFTVVVNVYTVQLRENHSLGTALESVFVIEQSDVVYSTGVGVGVGVDERVRLVSLPLARTAGAEAKRKVKMVVGFIVRSGC
jgi:hypothetical protein